MEVTLTGADNLSRLLKRKARTYTRGRQLIINRAKTLGLRVAEDHWFGISQDVRVFVEDTPVGFKIVAEGKDVLFLEFGAGITYASQKHPLASQMGYGPGTFDGKGHWNDPNGWFYYSNDPTKVTAKSDVSGQGVAHTFGNPAWGASYKSALAMKQEFTAMVIKELTRA